MLSFFVQVVNIFRIKSYEDIYNSCAITLYMMVSDWCLTWPSAAAERRQLKDRV